MSLHRQIVMQMNNNSTHTSSLQNPEWYLCSNTSSHGCKMCEEAEKESSTSTRIHVT